MLDAHKIAAMGLLNIIIPFFVGWKGRGIIFFVFIDNISKKQALC
jgi:hypothetical protein